MPGQWQINDSDQRISMKIVDNKSPTSAHTMSPFTYVLIAVVVAVWLLSVKLFANCFVCFSFEWHVTQCNRDKTGSSIVPQRCSPFHVCLFGCWLLDASRRQSFQYRTHNIQRVDLMVISCSEHKPISPDNVEQLGIGHPVRVSLRQTSQTTFECACWSPCMAARFYTKCTRLYVLARSRVFVLISVDGRRSSTSTVATSACDIEFLLIKLP